MIPANLRTLEFYHAIRSRANFNQEAEAWITCRQRRGTGCLALCRQIMRTSGCRAMPNFSRTETIISWARR